MFNKIYIQDDTPGSLSNINEIKALICYTIKEANRPLNQDQLNEIFQTNKTMNYFNFCAAIFEMLKTHHLVETFDKKLSLTKLGSDTAEIFKKNLPYSTVKKTLKTLKNFTERDKQNKNRKISIEKKEDGFTVKLIIEEIGTNLMELEIFCITENEAKKFKQKFENKTTEIYKSVLAILNDDFKSLENIAKKLQNDEQ